MKEVRQQEDKRALAGLRCAAEAVGRLLGHLELGVILARLFKKILCETPRLRELLLRLGSGDVPADQQKALTSKEEKLLNLFRAQLGKVLSCGDVGSLRNATCSTDVRAEILRRAATDPAVKVCEWPTQGGNAGLSEDPTRT